MNCVPKATGAIATASPPGHVLRRGLATFALLLAMIAVASCEPTMPAPVGPTAAPESSVVYNREAAFSVGIVPNRAPPVTIGDALAFQLSSSQDGYGHLYLLNSSDEVWVLAENLRLQANAQHIYPPLDGGFALRAAPPAGVERVLLLVTRHPFVGFGRGAAAQGPVQLPLRAAAFVADLNAATRGLHEDAWVVMETRVETVAN